VPGDLLGFPSVANALGTTTSPEAMVGTSTLLRELESLGTVLYSETRPTKIVGANWADKTPMPFAAGYLAILPADAVCSELVVPRRLS
jgi:hypothetical protein